MLYTTKNKIKAFIYRHSKGFSALLAVLLFAAYIHTSAIGSPYQPGETFDPACVPDEVNCIVQIIPDQTGNGGKYLTTDGTTTSWGTVTAPVWGAITGTLSNQTDLQAALNTKEVTLTFSTGLTRTSNTITNNLSVGVSGGQSVIGGTASGNNLTLSSTSNATKGKILFGTSAYDEVNNRLGVGTATPSSKLDITTNSLGLSPTTSSGLALVNTTVATVGAQQISPAIRWSGSGWKTNAVAGSQAVDMRMYLEPVQGASAPTGILRLQKSINGGAYSGVIAFTTEGNILDVSGQQGTLGQILTSNGSGSGVNWATPTTPTLPSTQIAFGDGSNAITGSSSLAWDNSQLNVVGDIVIGSQSNATASGYTLINSLSSPFFGSPVPGKFQNQTGVDGVSSFAVYDGHVYMATAEPNGAAIYESHNNTTDWRLATYGPGQILISDDPVIDSIVLAVYNGKLYAGTQTDGNEGRGSLYSFDGGTWTKINLDGEFGSETTVNGISDLVVYDGSLYVATQDTQTDIASVYKFNGVDAFTRTNTTLGACRDESTDILGGKLAVYKGRLYWGTQGSNGTARLCVYVGLHSDSGTAWTILNRSNTNNSSLTPGKFTSTGIPDIKSITSMTVHSGKLFFATDGSPLAAGGQAEIYSYDQLNDEFGTEWTTDLAFQNETTTPGQIDMTSVNAWNDVVSVDALREYNGRLYAADAPSGHGQVYEYDDTTRRWTVLTADNPGTFGSETGVYSANALISFNGLLYVGTTKTDQGSVYTWSKTNMNSYGLKFDDGSRGYGMISFVGNQSVQGGLNTGTFLFDHSIVSTTGAYDVAEDYPTREEGLTAGDVMVLNPNEVGLVKRSTKAYDSTVVGIYSEKPGLRLSQKEAAINGLETVPIALAGRVPVKITTENGVIKSGDFLTSSATKPGYAMKATKPGFVIGQALEPFSGTSGKIMVFIKNNYYYGQSLKSLLAPITLSNGFSTNPLNTQGLAYFLSQKEKLNDGVTDLSELLTDRLSAQLEVITPTVITDTLRANKIEVGSIPDIEKLINEMDIKIKGFSSFDTNDATSLGSLILNFIKDQVVLIKEMTVGVLHIDSKICVDDVCATKEEFKALLEQAKNLNRTPAADGGEGSDQPPTITDICLNIDGDQGTVPGGMKVDDQNKCVANDASSEDNKTESNEGEGESKTGDQTPPASEPEA